MGRMDRREFLAVGAMGTAGLALENQAKRLAAPEKPWNARTERSLRKFLNPVPTACAACPNHCALLAYRDGDRVVQVGPSSGSPRAPSLCPRAYESLESLYDPERVLRPLRRTGKRGEGKWAEISWGEALDQVARAMSNAPGTAYVDLGRPDPVAGEILGALGITRVIEHHASRRWGAREAQRAVYGAPLASPDVSRARTVLLIGARPLDGASYLPALARELIEARAKGPRVISVGPFEGATGSLADEWISSRPGTETLVALGLARVILSNRWHKAEVLSQALGTSGEKILEALLPYTVDLVEAATGIPALQFLQIARRFVGEGPSLCLVDSAGTRSAQALEAAAAILNSVELHPEAVGIRLAHGLGWLPRDEPSVPRTRAVKDIMAGNEKASLYLAYRANPVYWSPRSDWVRRVFADEGRIGLLVAMDNLLTETALLADLVLPAAADLELWNLFGAHTPQGQPYVALQQPATRRPAEPTFLRQPGVPPEQLFDGPKAAPLGEARQLGDALLEILALLGHPARARFPHADTGSYVRQAVDSEPNLAANGGFARLAQEGVWLGKGTTYPWAAQNGYPTASRAVEVTGKLVHQVPEEFKRLEGEAFALVVLEHPELDSGYSNTRWGREIRHQNPILINLEAAQRMGLKEGDRVVVRTAVGEAVAHVLPIRGIHPQAVAMAEDFGHWGGGVAATARAEKTGAEPAPFLVSRKDFLSNPLGIARQATQPGEVPWWSDYGPGVSLSVLSPFVSDEHGAQAWREIRVTVKPV